jgi:late competence protein required for DNA uptake (superfamily II DNA/RNA helicase)
MEKFFDEIVIRGKKYVPIKTLLRIPNKYEILEKASENFVFNKLYLFDFHISSKEICKIKIKVIGRVFNKDVCVFHSIKLDNVFKVNSKIPLCGEFSIENNIIYCSFPRIAYDLKPGIYPVYDENIGPKTLQEILSYTPKEYEFIKKMHYPNSLQDAQNVLDILGSHEIELIKSSFVKEKKEPLIKNSNVSLPFDLTEGQKKVLKDIYNDLESPYQTFRLIQGDVGSGKTLVAILSAAKVVENGKKVVLIAPTKILVSQLYENFKKYLNYDIVCTLDDKHFKEKIENAQIIIGTHALFYDVEIPNLGLLIIDEQHRFGVAARNKLLKTASLLMMTATPIPRTYEMILKSFLNISILEGKPKSAKVTTYVYSLSKTDEILDRIILNPGKKVFWISKTIKETEYFYEIAKDRINSYIVHGKIKDNKEIIDNFKYGIIFGTTVLEVGIDLPDLDIVIIYKADAFGLAQIHQLRGRVGRHKDGLCLLIGNKLSKLNTLKNMDCFQLANLDHNMRGYGKIGGVEQSGFESFFFLKEIRGNLVTNRTEPPITEDYKNEILILLKKYINLVKILY